MNEPPNPPGFTEGSTPSPMDLLNAGLHLLNVYAPVETGEAQNNAHGDEDESDQDSDSDENGGSIPLTNLKVISATVSACEVVKFCNTNDRFTTRHGLRYEPHHFVTYHFPDLALLRKDRGEKPVVSLPYLHERRFVPQPRPAQPGRYKHFSVVPTELGDKALQHFIDHDPWDEQSPSCSCTGCPLSTTIWRMLRLRMRLLQDETETFQEAMTRVTTFQGVSKISMVQYRYQGRLWIRLRRSTNLKVTGEETSDYNFDMDEWELLNKLLGVHAKMEPAGSWGFGKHYGFILSQLLTRSTDRAYWAVEHFLLQQGYKTLPNGRLKWYTYTPPDELLSVAPVFKVTSESEHDRKCSMCLEAFSPTFLGHISTEQSSNQAQQMVLQCRSPGAEENQDGETPIRLHCGHVFGEACIRLWCAERSARPTCPTCRSPIFSGIVPCPPLERWYPYSWWKMAHYKTQNLDKGWPAEHDHVCSSGTVHCESINGDDDTRFKYDGSLAVHHLGHMQYMLQLTITRRLQSATFVMKEYQNEHPEDTIDYVAQSARLQQLRPDVVLTDHGRPWNIVYTPEWKICYSRLRNILRLWAKPIRFHPRCLYLQLRGEMARALWGKIMPQSELSPVASVKDLAFPKTRPGFVQELEDILKEIVEFLRRSSVVGDDLLQLVWHQDH